eukprot:TRINITY_DN22161_c0_g1_i1.p1 TRINITY_DN22161_c0_g1~~TRINITY_DN22161_c0_g1_i1.p1  ORF type:complete len:316 (+),score=64.58 TRINITY_DN22161_c0_g1_i1:108-1055(+)
MIRRPPRSTLSSSSAASDVYKRQVSTQSTGIAVLAMAAPRAQPMFYLVQNEDDLSHPNAFFAPATGAPPTLADFLQHFPLPSEDFHFRFQAQDDNGDYFWADAPQETSLQLPAYRGRVLCKALRLTSRAKAATGSRPRPQPNPKPKSKAPVVQPAPATMSTPDLKPTPAPQPVPEQPYDPFDPNFGAAPASVVQPGSNVMYGNNDNMKGSQLDSQLQARMKDWATKGGAQAAGTGLRNLLCTVHEVLWDGAPWEPKTLSQLITSGSCKTAYRKVMLIVHPDRNGKASPQQRLVAERIFNVLTVAWDEFSEKEGCK